MALNFLEALRRGPLLCDGGYYLEMERRCIGSYANGIPLGAMEHPEGLLEMHREFERAGAEVIQAMAWGVGKVTREMELHETCVKLARQAAGEAKFVAGTLSPCIYFHGSKYERMDDADHKYAKDFFERRIGMQVDAGVDLMIVETFSSVEEAAVAIPICKQSKTPSVVCLTFRDNDFTRDGFRPGDAAKRLVDLGADVVGVNCMRPWPGLMPVMREIRDAVDVPITVQPTAYELEPGENFNRCLCVANMWGRVEPRVVTRFAMADYAKEASAMGVNLIGSCCGSLPYHVRAMAEALGKPVSLPDIDRGYRAK